MSTPPGDTGNGNLVVLKLRSKSPGRFAHTIYQEDLERLLLRRKRAREVKKELREMQVYVATALRTGAHVEDGVHIAELIPVARGASRTEACTYFRLEVR